MRKGDMIKIISGKEKGKIGEIIKILRQSGQVIVKDTNVKKKHLKPKKKVKLVESLNLRRLYTHLM